MAERNLCAPVFVLTRVRIAAQPAALGATVHGELVEFHLWAPRLQAVTLRLQRRVGATFRAQQDFPMLALGEGYWGLALAASPGDRYQYVIGSLAVPDPVSRLLPEGVHGPSEIVDPTFAWADDHWR